MRFKKHIELEYGLKQIEIAPLIDVVFLLLVFFLLTSNFVNQPGMKISLPKALTAETLWPQSLEIVISGESTVYFDNKPVTAGELKSLISQAGQRGQSVMIKSDRRAALGKTVEIWDLCRASGISQTSIATNE
ncbi:MAG: biopolymer transporter ExbD [Candidatus Omnitrophota bacterium]